jgi:uncharacterized protein (UPF0335 family)
MSGKRARDTTESSDGVGAINLATARQLASFIERIERLEEEAKALRGDIAEVYDEAKSTGFDVKALRKIIAKRRKDQASLAEETAIEETYIQALGMLVGTPLGTWAHGLQVEEGKGRTKGTLAASGIVVEAFSEALEGAS